MSVGETRVKQEPETELELNEAPDLLYTYKVPIEVEIEYNQEDSEPLCDSAGVKVEACANHVVKDELLLGPEQAQSCTAALSTSAGTDPDCEPHTPPTPDIVPTNNAGQPFQDKATIPEPPAPLSQLHQKRYTYGCDICKKGFARTDLLRIHKRTHTGEKPYSCEVCNREFAQLAHLKVHAMIHTGEKPYRCEICNMGFRQVSSLKRHGRTHAGEKPHACSACGKRFTRRGHLVKHELARHGGGS